MHDVLGFTLGQLAVALFFFLSGYLIVGSYDRRPDARSFLTSRLLRLFPGLSVSLVLTVCVLGPALTSLSSYDYFANPETARFFWRNFLLLEHAPALPGVFLDNPLPEVVNASLWTLAYEFRCYLLVLLLGLAGLLNSRVIVALWVGAVATTFIVDSSHQFTSRNALFASYFLAGSLLYFWQPPDPVRAAVSRVRIPYLGRFGDLSYGIYIYAFPVQQTVAWAWPLSPWWVNGLISSPISIARAILSWRFVEAPALALKSGSKRIGLA